VKAYDRIGAPYGGQLASRFPDAMAGGFCAGARNKLTVVDIDSTDDRLFDEIQRLGSGPRRCRSPHRDCVFGVALRDNGQQLGRPQSTRIN
jgi:hypothetical protein